MVRINNNLVLSVALFIISMLLIKIDTRMWVLPVFSVVWCWLFWTEEWGAPWIPASQKAVDSMLRLSGVKKGSSVYDLGSGDGRIVISATRMGAYATGVEIDPLRVWASRIRIGLAGLGKRAKIEHADLRLADLKNADVVTLFLLPDTLYKIENRLKRELRRNSRVVSYQFKFKEWKPVKADKANRVYLYKV